MTVDRKFRLNNVRLCSMSITVISTLLRTVPHLDGTSVLSTLCNCICVFPLALPSKVPEAQHKSLNQTRTASMPDTTQPISSHFLRWNRSNITLRFWWHPSVLDTWTGIHCVRLPDSYLTYQDDLTLPANTLTNVAKVFGLQPVPAHWLPGIIPSSSIPFAAAHWCHSPALCQLSCSQIPIQNIRDNCQIDARSRLPP